MKDLEANNNGWREDTTEEPLYFEKPNPYLVGCCWTLIFASIFAAVILACLDILEKRNHGE